MVKRANGVLYGDNGETYKEVTAANGMKITEITVPTDTDTTSVCVNMITDDEDKVDMVFVHRLSVSEYDTRVKKESIK